MTSSYTYRWFSLAIVFLAVGGSFAFLVGMSRAPHVSAFFPEDYFRYALAGHVIFAILLWLLSFTVVLWSINFGGRGLATTWLAAAVGAVMIAASVLRATGEAVTNNYVPTIDDPAFLTGLALFFLAFTINVFYYLRDAAESLMSDDPLKSVLSVSVIIGFFTALSVLLSIYTIEYDAFPTLYYERLYWTPGHIQQIMNGALLVAAWYMLRRRMGVEIRTTRAHQVANAIFLVSTVLMLSFLFLFTPGARESRIASETVYGLGLGTAVFIHAYLALRGLKRDFGSVAYVTLLLSFAIYFLGVAIAYGGFGEDLRVPAHYHGAVTSLTLALMGLSYYLVGDIRKVVTWDKAARLQPYIYGTGMIVFILGLFVSGLTGVSRKTYGAAEFCAANPVSCAALAGVGVGTVMAVAGGVLFIAYILLTLIRKGRKESV